MPRTVIGSSGEGPLVDHGEGIGDELSPEARREAELRRLVAAAAAGDESALDRLLRSIEPYVVKYCRARLPTSGGGIQNADDVAQDVLLAVCDAVGRFTPGTAAVMAFVYGIARNKVADAFRSAGRDLSTPTDILPDAVDDEPGPEPSAVSSSDSARLRRLLEHLSPHHREVLVLRIALGFGGSEVATMLGSTPGAVRVTQHRALTRLRALMSEHATPDEH